MEISNDTKLTNKVAIVGRMVSENNGIDKIIKYCLTNHELVHLIVCRKDGRGHRAGHSLIPLFDRRITKKVKIIMSKSPCQTYYHHVRKYKHSGIALPFII